MGNQKILILSDKMQITAFSDDPKEHILAYFVYCENEDLKTDLKQKVGEDNYNYFSTLEDTFRVAYIQETIERCYECVHRWGEYFIMAPIPDNSTFAFQSQVIEEYLDIQKESETEKEFFSDKNGYVSSDFIKPASVEKLQYLFSLIKAPPNSEWRAFFYFKDWMYRYDRIENSFVPETFCENRSMNFEHLCEQRPTRKNERRRKCNNCQVIHSKCACKELSLFKVKEKVDKYLMNLSLGTIQTCESFCSLVFPEDWEKGPIDCFMLILSDIPVLDSSLRQSFDELVNIFKNSANYNGAYKTNTVETISVSPDTPAGLDKKKEDLCHEIEAYLLKHSGELGEIDCSYINFLLNKVKSCSDCVSLIQLDEEWKNKLKGK